MTKPELLITDDESANSSHSINIIRSNNITLDNLLHLNPIKHGYIEKKSNSWWNKILSLFFFFIEFEDVYEKRYIVVVGNYLYRFISDDSNKIKGIPIPLDSVVSIKKLDDSLTFQLSTFRKQYLFKAESEEECDEWIRVIKDRKYHAIREALGHEPIAADVLALNKKALIIVTKKIDDESKENIDTMSPLHSFMPTNPGMI